MSIPLGAYVACDTETTGLYPFNGDRPFAFSFCNEEGDSHYIYWKVNPLNRKPQIVSKDLEEMRTFFARKDVRFVFHNAKFDIRMISTLGIKIPFNQVEDTYFAAHILRGNEPTLSLKPLAKKYLDYGDEDQKELQQAVNKARREGRKLGWKLHDEPNADYWTAPRELLVKYAVGDVERTILLWKMLSGELEQDEACMKFYRRELTLLQEIYAMEERGVRVDMAVVDREIKAHQERMAKNMAILKKEIGPDFNPNSAPQVQKYVYETRGFQAEYFTKNREDPKPSTSARALRSLKDPIIFAIRDYKSAEKAISSFFQKYKDTAVLGEDGLYILHPDYQQVGPVTGRLACRNPNLQNVANALTSRNDIPMQARTPFVPRPGHVWFCIDYSSQEIWIFADGADDKDILGALYAGRDMHGEVADFIWGKGTVAREAAAGHKNSRTAAKMLFFGIIYGMGINSCVATLASSGVVVDRKKGEDILERYHNFFPGVRRFMERTVSTARKQGFIRTAWGRKIFIDQEFAYRSVNYYVQGSGADAMKESMLGVGPYLRSKGVRGGLLMTIHDELVVEVDKRDVTPALIAGIKKIMEDHKGNLKIPKLPVEVERVTKSWNIKEKVKDLTTVAGLVGEPAPGRLRARVLR